MGSKIALNGPHAAGIYADMSLDGPEIGSLRVKVVKAKNLTDTAKGKQDVSCSVRLGKESRTTKTDRGGGQRPQWNQELCYTVHDSPDYLTLKVAVSSERTNRNEPIGEAYLSLRDIVPSGGSLSRWFQLTLGQKYGGDVLLDITYKKNEELPPDIEKPISRAEELQQEYGTLHKIRRKPVVARSQNGYEPIVTDVVIPERPAAGRARHGPREYQTPSRGASLPPDALTYPHSAASLMGPTRSLGQQHPNHSASALDHIQEPYYEEPGLSQQPYRASMGDMESMPMLSHSQAADIIQQLPQLSLSSRQRASLPPQRPASPSQRYAQIPPATQQQQFPARPHSYVAMPHHSAPAVPSMTSEEHYQNNGHPGYPRGTSPSSDQRQHQRPRRSDASQNWQPEYAPEFYEEPDGSFSQPEQLEPPPPPPRHSHSAPTVPPSDSPRGAAYAQAPLGSRQPLPSNLVPGAVDRSYATPQPGYSRGHPVPMRGQAPGDYVPTREYPSVENSPSAPHDYSPSGYAGGPPLRQAPHRHSTAEMYTTPPNPQAHLGGDPLSGDSAASYLQQGYPQPSPSGHHQYQREPSPMSAAPLVKPRAISPSPSPVATAKPNPRNAYSIQHPIRAFESSDDSPLSHSRPYAAGSSPVSNRTPPVRKSVSPRPTNRESAPSTTPFSPDSFNVHNPNASYPNANGAPAEAEPGRTSTGRIIGWRGQEIDPSDHLPPSTWAPEPEPKGPTKVYGQGRDRDFGPRTNLTSSVGNRLSKDTVLKVGYRNSPSPSAPRQQQHTSSPLPRPEAANVPRDRYPRSSGQSPSYPAQPSYREPLAPHDNYNNPRPNPASFSHDQFSFRRPYGLENNPAPSRIDGYASSAGAAPPPLPAKEPISRPSDHVPPPNPSYNTPHHRHHRPNSDVFPHPANAGAYAPQYLVDRHSEPLHGGHDPTFNNAPHMRLSVGERGSGY